MDKKTIFVDLEEAVGLPIGCVLFLESTNTTFTFIFRLDSIEKSNAPKSFTLSL